MRSLLSLAIAIGLGTGSALAMGGHHMPGMGHHMPMMGHMRCGPGNPRVWVNSDSHVYHMMGSRYYGHTAHGMYMCKRSAIGAHNHMAARTQQ
ncbi:MAG: hypothetical protein M3Z14_06990 [Candidatus Eremiobacteraeota bacterium]|nr:hypothetical protein [Candidatus Eremiobacteraeota bacterium]